MILASFSTAQEFNQTLRVAYNFELNVHEVTSVTIIDNEDQILYIETVNITNDADVKELRRTSRPGIIIMILLHPKIFERFPNIERLYLNNVGMEIIPYNALENCEKITEITLTFNNFIQIPQVFRNCVNLKYLSFRSNFLLNSTSENDLEGLTNMEILDLSRSSLRMINENFFIHTPKLQFLDLSFSGIVNFTSNSFFPSSLRKLYFSGMRFT